MISTRNTPAGDCPIIPYSMFNESMIDFEDVQTRPRGNNGTRTPRAYINCICAFDIETSRLPGSEDAFCYLWQFQIDERVTVMGRDLHEAGDLFRRLAAAMTAPRQSLVILVHNLSYEFHFMQGIYNFRSSEVFAVAHRHVAKCTMYEKHLEFRCTYIHSNMSLSMYTEKMKTKHRKLDGDVFDYHKIRYPWTALTDYEIAYGQNDVLGLVEAYRAEMQRDGDTLYTIPMTSTGYVRRDCKHAMRMWSRYRIKAMQPDEKIYAMLRAAFRGGDVHANRYYVGYILKDVKSADRSSSYPDVMCNARFPMSPFQTVRDPSETQLEREIGLDHALLITVRFVRIRLRNPYYGFPYLPLHKCRIAGRKAIDNGRILSADELETTITDVDWKIIRDVYVWDRIEFIDMMWSRYGRLPAPLVLTVQEYYKKKTELKGVPGQEDFYTKAKNLLNATYGMMVENPIRQNILYELGNPYRFREEDEPVDKLLMQNYHKAWLCYQHGIWITAWARFRLYEGIQIANGGENAIYCDTDSVKYIGDYSFDAYNAQRIKDSRRSGSYAQDPAGVTHYMGVFEPEKTYTRFLTHGCKRYAYEYGDGKPHVTISGVNKRLGARELEEKGGLEALKPGFVFSLAGGTESVYNDNSDYDVEISGHLLHIGPNICIKDSTYTLSYTADYERLLSDPALLRKIRHSFGDYKTPGVNII